MGSECIEQTVATIIPVTFNVSELLAVLLSVLIEDAGIDTKQLN